jgi:UDP-3-O-[3-hydroxymyristoyl] glucosamine N-acyltransferase
MPDAPSITAAELARLLDGELTGDGAHVVCAVGTLEEAGPQAVSWVGKADLMPRVAASQAGIVVIPAACAPPAERTTIGVADPDLAMCQILEALKPPSEPVPAGVDRDARVAETATVAGASIAPHVFVGARASVGPGTVLHPGVYVGAYSRIGRDCVLWPNVVVREYTSLGDRVVIHPNATIGADGFGYQQRGGRHHKIPQIGRVVIEDDVEIGANTCIDRARSGETRIGRGTKIDNLVQIGHNVRIGEDCILVSQCGVSGSTTLGHHVVLAGQVGLVDHLRIGNNVVVAAKSGVAESLPDGKVYRGIPAVEVIAFGRQAVGIRRLPKIIEQLRDLLKRVERLESTADHTRRG